MLWWTVRDSKRGAGLWGRQAERNRQWEGAGEMKAVLCKDFIGLEGLEIGEIDEPVPGPEEVLIEVHAASVSFMDWLMVSGGYQMRPPLPYVPGTESAGIVVSVGDDVTRFRIGDRVACCDWIGGFGERMTAKEWKTVHVPDNVDFIPASTVIHNYNTARQHEEE